MKGILNRLKQIRKSNKLSVNEVSARLGVSKTTYYYWEEGAKKLPIKYIVPLCEIYDVDANYIFGTKPRSVDENIITLYRSLDECSKQVAYMLLTNNAKDDVLLHIGEYLATPENISKDTVELCESSYQYAVNNNLADLKIVEIINNCK